MGRKFLGFCNQGQSSSSSSTSQRESFPGAGRQCGSANSFRSPRQLKSYTACGKIYKAACRGDDATVMSRLKFGKNGINEPDKKNRTILHYACAYGHPDVVILLMEWKCDIDLRDSDNSTALIKASQHEQEECMAILLRCGADPNAADSRGNTALHYAVWSNNTSMAKILLAHGANVSIRNKDGISPLILALTENNKDLAKILVNQRSKLKEVDELDRKSIGSNSCGFSHSSKEYEDKYQRVIQLLIEDARTEEMQDQLQRYNLKEYDKEFEHP
ncbi:ankyrin repeat domain-containing protein 26-like [Acomys russatus]|uniref:ankyrin repeat domain-containing protein 26-like n=1 Tax=Acomys russatus TaxID=60746 RepID=UPI0021E262B7|nr:ankyrin repeat domain-containing protein 26-like [Acomys russatus]